jgi:sugar phosphate isomerase/epimerase
MMRLGVKAALHDAEQMARLDVELLEVHLGRDDLPRRFDALVSTFSGIGTDRGLDMVVHAPEFMGPARAAQLVDLASLDERTRRLSVDLLARTIDLAGSIGAKLIVVHPGGIAPPEHSARTREEGGDRLGASLDPLKDRAHGMGVMLVLENMPWFYNVKPQGPSDEGGAPRRWESTLLVEPERSSALLDCVDGLALDVSHAYLHIPEGGMDAIEGFITLHGDRVLHLHLSDALPPDLEGLQIGEGAVDFPAALRPFASRDITAVPEVIGGHRMGGLGFQRALEELRRVLDGL